LIVRWWCSRVVGVARVNGIGIGTTAGHLVREEAVILE
jgi:hypothetical protein